jgi:uncharacterized membrane protein required for colicin V production
MEEILSKVGIVDIVMLVALVWGLLIGFAKGFSRQFGKLFNLCLSITAALLLYEKVAEILYTKTIMQQPIAESLCLFVLLIVNSLIFKLLLVIFNKVVTIQFVYFIERVGGAFIGGLRYVLFFAYIANLVLLWPSDYIKPFFSDKSFAGPVIMQIIPNVKVQTDVLKDALAEKYFSGARTAPVTLVDENTQAAV